MDAKTAAAEIAGQMNTDDRRGFTRARWREGVGAMIAQSEEWQALDTEEVLEAIEEHLDTYERD